MPAREVITAETGIKTPLLSQAIKYGDTIFVSGNVGMDFVKNKMIEGSVADRTVGDALINLFNTHECHRNKRSRISKLYSKKQARLCTIF